MPSNVSSRKLSLVWKDIVTMEHRNERMFNLFQENVAFSIGSKQSISFWKDKWNGEVSLTELVQRLFSLASNKEASLWLMHGDDVSHPRWKFHFRRSLFAWEEQELMRLQNCLTNAPSLDFNKDDSLVWKSNSSGVYSVNSMYKLMEAGFGNRIRGVDFIWK